ncbi:MAG: PSD1 domain-containing protein [Planctomycetales bacterium]|nr:PSD1 domain-containing protein [Planctomycetales bacterium]
MALLHTSRYTAIRRYFRWLAFAVALPLVAEAGAEEPVQYGRDVLPILSNACFHCHGPDAAQREADLRLDTREGATADLGGYRAVVAGNLEESELWQRIQSDDDDERMPPVDSVVQLQPEQIATLRRWIEQGAPFEGHWAFAAPVRPAVPQVATSDWVRNPIDAFVLARLEREQLRPMPPADRETLLRRVVLDLTGLPPSPAETAAFLADQQPLAYERQVDRLLKSPHYGERMAWDWLDAARYADSNGYQGDRERTMWPWRDWVVKAMNDNLPYDQFTIWQLAGDLLPQATAEQRLATGFCRNHAINGEGGRIAEENRVDYVLDMTETMGTIWMAVTLNCARCHDHKFDPFTRRDYYALTAFFNQTPVTGAGGDPQTPPVLAFPDREQQLREAELQQQLDDLDVELKQREQQLEQTQAAWERDELAKQDEPMWQTLLPQHLQAESQTLTLLDDRSILASGVNPANDTYEIVAPVEVRQIAALRLEALRHETMTHGGLARSDSGNFVLTEIELSLEPANREAATAIAIGSAVATFEQGNLKAATAFDGNPKTGWAVYEGKPVDRDHRAVFRFSEPVDVPPNARLRVILRHDSPHASHNLGHFRLSVSSRADAPLDATGEALALALSTPPKERTAADRKAIQSAQRQTDRVYQSLVQEREQRSKTLANLRGQFAKVMVMADQPQPRTTFMLDRGLYNKPGDEVAMNVPASLPPLPAGEPANRLALARWLVSAEHPLTARVTVNRLWRQVFGVGLVKTTEDFGVQGERPVQQDLLDWLAVEFRESGWDVKALMRLIVTSNTYRQSSNVSAELYERDPENRLLGRGPRFRMPSWMLRDQALAASGLLERQLGGRPVNPYQPPGVWEEASFGKKKYVQDTGAALHRRSLYTFWRRIAAPTMFFDNAARQVCSVKAMRTNTPLHALLTLNDTTFVEAARVLAERSLREVEGEAARIDSIYRRILARAATAEEQAILAEGLRRSRQQYADDVESARQLLAVGETPRDASLDEVEHAAWTSLALAVLNLDEAVTKE